MRKCKICGNSLNTGSQIKIRLGVICPSCYEKLPNCAKENVGQLTSGQIRKLHSLFQVPKSKFRWKIGNIRLGDKSILFSGKEIFLKDLRSFRFQFHPTTFFKNKALGKITVAIETKNPHIYLEDYCFDEAKAMEFHVLGNSIIYHYANICRQVTHAIQSALDDGTYDLSEFFNDWKNSKKEYKKEEKQSSRQSNQSSTQDTNKDQSELERAMALYSVAMPYKKSEIREKRNKLLKQFHPDCPDGSEEKCKEINLAYQLLSRYAEE